MYAEAYPRYFLSVARTAPGAASISVNICTIYEKYYSDILDKQEIY